MRRELPLYVKVLVLLLLTIFAITIFASFVLSIAGGIFAKKEYLEVWDKGYYQQFDDPRLKLVAHAILSPSAYNLQPWLVKLSEDNQSDFLVYVNTERLFAGTDPTARETMLSMGAFLQYMDVAASELGLTVNTTYFPSGALDEGNLASSLQATPIAKVSVTTGNRFTNPLYENLFLPSTNREFYESNKLTELDKTKLTNQMVGTTTVSFYQNQQDTANIGNKFVSATISETAVYPINLKRGELFRMNEYEKNKFKFGLSFASQGKAGLAAILQQGAVTLVPSLMSETSAVQQVIKSARLNGGNVPNGAIIATQTNTRQEQLDAGRSYANFALTAHNLGYACQPLSASIQDIPETAQEKQEMQVQYGNGNTIQMVMRVGVPTQTANKSMRVPLNDLLKLSA